MASTWICSWKNIDVIATLLFQIVIIMELKLLTMKFVFTLVDKMQTFHICMYNAYVCWYLIWYTCLRMYLHTYIHYWQAYTADVKSQFYSLLALYYFAEYCNVEVLE